jgi:hypothetical protein
MEYEFDSLNKAQYVLNPLPFKLLLFLMERFGNGPENCKLVLSGKNHFTLYMRNDSVRMQCIGDKLSVGEPFTKERWFGDLPIALGDPEWEKLIASMVNALEGADNGQS